MKAGTKEEARTSFDRSFVNQTEIKKYVHEQGKQLEAEAMDAINQSVLTILNRALSYARAFKRIRASEIYLATRKVD